MVAYLDRGAGNDPKLFFFFFFFSGGRVSFTTKAQHFYNGQYGSNDLPRSRRSALSECFQFVVCLCILHLVIVDYYCRDSELSYILEGGRELGSLTCISHGMHTKLLADCLHTTFIKHVHCDADLTKRIRVGQNNIRH